MRAGEFVVALDQEPVIALLARLAVHPHEVPAPVQLLAVKLELEMALLQAPVRISDRRPRAIVPDDDRAAAILALGDRALKISIFEGMILDRDRKAFFARIEARAAGDRPALQDAVQRQPEVVMQPRGVVLLDDKDIAVRKRRRAL